MASTTSNIISHIYNVVCADSSSEFDWSFNGTEIEGRNEDVLFILSPSNIEFSKEVYQSSTVRRRKCVVNVKFSIFSSPDISPATINQYFESEICAKLFESTLAISKISCGETKYNEDYQRLETNGFITADTLYIY